MVLCTRCEALVPSFGRCPSCGGNVGVRERPTPEPPCLAVGDAIGRYRIAAVLTTHGRRRAYVGHDERGEAVVVKQHALEGAADRGRAHLLLQYERERAVLERLHHPAVPGLVDAFARGEDRYLVLERKPGSSLRTLWRARGRRRLGEPEAIMIAGAVADVLVYIHGRPTPVLHRDLSAGNVLYAPDSEHGVSVIDFGTAASPGEPSVRMYTPGFDAPERHFSHEGDGPTTDLYALGAILHFLLTGHDPATSPPFLHVPVRELAADVSPRAEALCLWLLQPDPAYRPAEASLVARALRGDGIDVPDAARLWRAVQQAEGDTVRLLEHHAGRDRDPVQALHIARRLLARGRPEGARRVLLDALETLRAEREGWDVRVTGAVSGALAEIYLMQEDGARALAVAEEGRALAPGEIGLELALARSLTLLERGEDALARIEVATADASPALKTAREGPELLAARAERLLAAGRAVEAEHAAREVLLLDPRSFEAARILERAAVHAGRIPELEARCRAAPDDLAAVIALGLARLTTAAREEGLRLLQDALAAVRKGTPLDPVSERRLLRWHARRLAEEDGALEAALVLMDEMGSRHPRAPFFAFYGGLLAYLLERPEDALARFQRLRAMGESAEPDGEADEYLTSARADFWCGRCLEQLGRGEDALAAYGRAVSCAPAYADAVRHLRRLTAPAVR